jgi:hypothetical protein
MEELKNIIWNLLGLFRKFREEGAGVEALRTIDQSMEVAKEMNDPELHDILFNLYYEAKAEFFG